MAREDVVDAQKLSQKLSATPESKPCAREALAECTFTNCHWRCALDVIDELLGQQENVSGDEIDRLLDLRSHLRQRTDAESALRLFCELRVQMEQRHYLAFFRIRRWMENHLVAAVRVCPAAEPRAVRVKLDYYCFIAIRRACLCAALGRGATLIVPRVEFAFRALPAVVPQQTGAVAVGA